MIRKFKKIILGLYYRLKETKRLLTDKTITNGQSYFPEYADRRKSKTIIFFDQLKNILKYGDLNDFYYLYGFDIKGLRNENDYVDYAYFRSRREELMHRNDNSQVGVLRDKFFFSILSDALGFRSPRTIAIISKNEVYLFDSKQTTSLDFFAKKHNIDSYIKLVDGECAKGVFQVQINNGKIIVDGENTAFEKFKELLKSGEFLVQERIYQHELLSKLHPQSSNTIRLITKYDSISDRVIVLPSFFRIGTGNMYVDNWAAGGIALGIDTETGQLGEWGYYKPGFGLKTNIHPDSGVIFKDYEIPFFAEAKDLVQRYHMRLKNVHSIGWDIAITPEGPCIIEGNDNWEISVVQVANHGMKKEFELYMK